VKDLQNQGTKNLSISVLARSGVKDLQNQGNYTQKLSVRVRARSEVKDLQNQSGVESLECQHQVKADNVNFISPGYLSVSKSQKKLGTGWRS